MPSRLCLALFDSERCDSSLSKRKPGLLLMSFAQSTVIDAPLQIWLSGRWRHLPTHAHSDINNLQGVGSIVTINGRAWLVNDTTACPGARAGRVFHSDSSIPPMDRRNRLMTFESLILCNTQLLIRPSTSSGRC